MIATEKSATAGAGREEAGAQTTQPFDVERVRQDFPVLAQTVIYIRFFLSNEGERIIRAEVRYHLEEVGIGVEFINLTAADKEKFQALVNYYRTQPST